MAHNVTFGRRFLKGWCVGNQKARDHRLEFSPKAGEQEIVLTIADEQHQSGYRFDTRDPIWAIENAGQCPNQSGVHDQLSIVSCTDKELKLKHANSKEVELRYQLNVLKNDKPKPIDPIMSNGPHLL